MATGDAEFVLDIQSKANKLGMVLNEYGLWKHAKDSPDSNAEWELVEGRGEEEILKEIGMQYVVPEKRNFSYVATSSTPGRKIKFKV